MFKSKILFIAVIAISIISQSCTEEAALTGANDLQAEESIVKFEQVDADIASLFQEGIEQSASLRGLRDKTPQLVGPDLIISRITTSVPVITTPCGVNPMPGANCGINYSFSVEVRNIGNQTAPGGHEVALWYSLANGFVTATVSQSLAPGQSVTIPLGAAPLCSGPVIPSIEQLIGFADLFNDVAETNESNNRSRAYNICIF